MILENLKSKLRAVIATKIDGYSIPENGVIGGGAIANTLLNLLYGENLPINDVDVFIFSKVPLGEVDFYTPYGTSLMVHNVEDLGAIQEIYYTINTGLNKVNKIRTMLRGFHMNATQVAYDFNTDTLYYTPAFLRFLNHRKLLFTPLSNVDPVKAYKKYLEGVGTLPKEYLNKTLGMSNESFPIRENLSHVIDKMMTDPTLNMATGDWGIVFNLGNDKNDSLLECQIAIENVEVEYGRLTNLSRKTWSLSPRLFTIAYLIDSNYLQNDLIPTDALLDAINYANPIALSRFSDMETLTTVINKIMAEHDGVNSTLMDYFSRYLLSENDLDCVNTIVTNFNKYLDTQIIKPIFCNQITTPRQFVVADVDPRLTSGFLSGMFLAGIGGQIQKNYISLNDGGTITSQIDYISLNSDGTTNLKLRNHNRYWWELLTFWLAYRPIL